MTALSHASSNGHIKVEKHLWLFNWNMDIMGAGIQRNVNTAKEEQHLSEEERLALEIEMTARKYKNQYKSNERWVLC